MVTPALPVDVYSIHSVEILGGATLCISNKAVSQLCGRHRVVSCLKSVH